MQIYYMKNLLFFLLLPSFVIAQNTKSWKDLALNFYQHENYLEAINYYEKWLEADPIDKNSWYDLACCYALVEDTEKSIFALNKAITLGWLNCQDMQTDNDLKILHNNPQFVELTKLCEHNVQSNQIKDFELYHAKMESIGSYGVLLPNNYDKNKVYPLIIWIHGNGSSESYHAKIAKEFNLENAIIIFPRAPYINKETTENSAVLGWTSNQTDNLAKSDELYNIQGLLYIDWIHRCVQDVKQKHLIENKKCIVFGHSQGSAYSLAYAMTYANEVSAAMSFAGISTSKFSFTTELVNQLTLNNVYIEMLHGINDPMITTESVEKVYTSFKDANVNVKLNIIDAAHSLGNSTIAKDAIQKFLLMNLNE